MADQRNSNALVIIIVLVVLAVAGYAIMHAPDQRTPGQKVGDAIDNVREGNLDGAAKSLQNRTPAQKMGDAIEKAGDKVQKSTE